MIRESKTKIARTWELLIGPTDSFSKEARSVNSVLLISLILMAVNLPMNLVMGLAGSSTIAAISLLTLGLLYYLSRRRNMYRASMTTYAILSYVVLGVNYRYNDGIDGPTLLLFFLSFQLIIAMTPTRQHWFWLSLHLITVTGLLAMEYYNPDTRLHIYATQGARFTDIAATYVFSVIFIYVITAYLINSYVREKKLAKERADAIEAQNNILKDIAWMQSHKVRSHVATIMGLTDILQQDPDDPDNRNIIRNLKHVAQELDGVIHDINHLTTDKKKAGNGQPICPEV